MWHTGHLDTLLPMVDEEYVLLRPFTAHALTSDTHTKTSPGNHMPFFAARACHTCHFIECAHGIFVAAHTTALGSSLKAGIEMLKAQYNIEVTHALYLVVRFQDRQNLPVRP